MNPALKLLILLWVVIVLAILGLALGWTPTLIDAHPPIERIAP